MDKKFVLVMDEDLKREPMIEKCHYRICYANKNTINDYLNNIQYDIIVLDRDVLGTRLNTVITSIKISSPETFIFITTSSGDIESYVDLMCCGIHEYFMKPFKSCLIEIAISRALTKSISNELYEIS